MKVSINVPSQYSKTKMVEYITSNSDISNRNLTEHFVYLLQLTSFDYNINWIVNENRVELELPYQSLRTDERSKFAVDVPILALNTRQDLLSSILLNIMQDVSPERIKSHFQVVNNK